MNTLNKITEINMKNFGTKSEFLFDQQATTQMIMIINV